MKAGAVKAGTRDLCNASSYPLLAGRLGGAAAPPAVWRIFSTSHPLLWILKDLPGSRFFLFSTVLRTFCLSYLIIII